MASQIQGLSGYEAQPKYLMTAFGATRKPRRSEERACRPKCK